MGGIEGRTRHSVPGGSSAMIRAAETRKQKHDRRDARLMLDLLMRKDGFPVIWMPSSEQRDYKPLLRDRHQWVKIRTRVQNPLQAMARKLAVRLYWMMRRGWDYEQLEKFGSHGGQPGHRDGVKSNIE